MIYKSKRLGSSRTSEPLEMCNFKEDLSDSDFRFYINKNSNHPDYVFRRGSDLTSIERAAHLLEYDGTYILVSLNALRIAEIRCENGTTYSVDPDLPFVLVIPNGGSLLIKTEDNMTYYYDYTGIIVFEEHGNELDLTQKQWFEMAELTKNIRSSRLDCSFIIHMKCHRRGASAVSLC